MLLVGLFGLVTVVVVGSLAEIHAQSAGYRTSTDSGYGQLAWVVAEASNQTGSQLAGLMSTAAGLPNQPVPQTARTEIQQGLDDAVNSTAQQAARADGLVPPYPTGSVSDQFTQVMADRAKATADLRTTIDKGLGMAPLPIAGAPTDLHTVVGAADPDRSGDRGHGCGGRALRTRRPPLRRPAGLRAHTTPPHPPAPVGLGAGSGCRCTARPGAAGGHRVGAVQLGAVGPVPSVGDHRSGSGASRGDHRRAGHRLQQLQRTDLDGPDVDSHRPPPDLVGHALR